MVNITEDRLTEEKFKCTHCGKLRKLVKVNVRGGTFRAWLCKECYIAMLKKRNAKRKALQELNKMAMEILT